MAEEYFKTGDKGPTLRAKFNAMWATFQGAVANAVGVPGWSPQLAAEVDGERVLLRVVGWTGGAGNAPAMLGYVGANGLVASKADAINIRGGAITMERSSLGRMAYLDGLATTQVLRHIRQSEPGDIWRERLSDTQTVIKYHGDDGVIRTRTETWI